MKAALCLLLCLGATFPGFAAPVTIGYTNAVNAILLPQATKDRIGELKWFFAHASVGGNIMTGVQMLHDADPKAYPLVRQSVSAEVPDVTTPGTIYDYNRGNPGWQAKVDLFAKYVATNGWPSKMDVVMDKFCYVDFEADLNVYLASMQAMQATNETTIFVYSTIPLTIKDPRENYMRNVFNDGLRAWVKTNDVILYDIADIEAHDTNGVEQTFSYEGRVCQTLFPGYTADAGHLSTDYAKQLAAQGFYALAAAIVERQSPQRPSLSAEVQNSETGRSIVLRGQGAPNQLYRIEASADPSISDWSAVGEVTSGADGTFSVQQDSTFAQRFYRAVSQ